MRNPRIFSDRKLRTGSTIELGPGPARHILQVLRMHPGDALTVFDGHGGEYAAVIESGTRDRLHLEIGDHRARECESDLDITLWQWVCRGDRMDTVVQKATELGVTRLRPVMTERSIVRLDSRRAEKKAAHWRSVAIAACEQSGRNHVPDILPVMTLDDCFAGGVTGDALITDPQARASLLDTTKDIRAVTLLTGPEGGFTREESAAASAAGFRAINLGPRILRSETAPVVALALLQHRCGDL